jgi:hypothetical protein
VARHSRAFFPLKQVLAEAMRRSTQLLIAVFVLSFAVTHAWISGYPGHISPEISDRFGLLFLPAALAMLIVGAPHNQPQWLGAGLLTTLASLAQAIIVNLLAALAMRSWRRLRARD